MEDLKNGYTYKILARNASYGIWREADKAFVISRFKFTMNYVFEEYHWDASTAFGTAQPVEEKEKSPFDSEEVINEPEVLVYLNNLTIKLGAVTGEYVMALIKENQNGQGDENRS